MNKRIRKKKAKGYCGKKHNGTYQSWQCDNCGWDSIDDSSHSQITAISSDGDYWNVHCKCPVCGNKFDYTDGI